MKKPQNHASPVAQVTNLQSAPKTASPTGKTARTAATTRDASTAPRLHQPASKNASTTSCSCHAPTTHDTSHNVPTAVMKKAVSSLSASPAVQAITNHSPHAEMTEKPITNHVNSAVTPKRDASQKTISASIPVQEIPSIFPSVMPRQTSRSPRFTDASKEAMNGCSAQNTTSNAQTAAPMTASAAKAISMTHTSLARLTLGQLDAKMSTS